MSFTFNLIQLLQNSVALGKEFCFEVMNTVISYLEKQKVSITVQEKNSFFKILLECSKQFKINQDDVVFHKFFKIIDECPELSDCSTTNNSTNRPAVSTSSICVATTVTNARSNSNNQNYQVGSGLKEKIELISKKVTNFKKFNVMGVKMVFRLNEFKDPEENILEGLRNTFNEVVNEIVKNSKEGSKISMYISLPNSPHEKPIWSSLRPVSELNGEHILSLISSINQSNSTFLSDDIIQIDANIVNFPFGKGRINPKMLSEADVLLKKTSVVDVGKEGDVHCLPRSICYVLDSEIAKNSLSKAAKKLCKLANVNVSEINGCSLLDLYKFQKYLNNYQIVVFNDITDPNSILFKIPYNFFMTEIKKIYLYYSALQNHYYVIKSLTAFFNKNYTCNYCDNVSNYRFHKCAMKCPYCYCYPPCQFTSTLRDCLKCNRSFRGEHCYLQHIQNKIRKDSVCDSLQICKICNKFLNFVIRGKRDHTCNEYYCQTCYKVVPQEHLCYIQPYRGKGNSRFLIIFFDCETTQDTIYGASPDTHLHIVNLITAHQVCFSCYNDSDISNDCVNCGKREHIFQYNEDIDVVKQFIDYVFMTRSYVTNIICVAHNFQGFDGHFLISELLNRKFAINPVMNGTKIMKLTCKNVSFIDSLNFLPFPLSKFSDVFGFENHNKGYYPYFFNTKENFNYIGKYPTPKMYGYNSMKQKERQKFLEWYSSNCTKMFNNKNEMLKYCINDVTILRLGCLSFMKEFLEITAVNPFTESLTIASACMLVFRKNFLKAQTLAIMPKNKYLKGKQFSFASLKWLHFKGMNTTVGILSALNTGEVKLEKGGLFVDGFDPKTNTVYEFFGCFYHGCSDCFKFNSSDIIKGSKCDTLSQRHESTMKKISAIRKNGYNLEYIWECDFKDFLKRNPAVDKQITEDLAYFTLPLTPRDAVYGGRTEVFRTYAKINAENEIIRYLDFTSLYPYINKYAPYPIGHPTIFRNQTPPVSEILEMHGFISCSILPPDNLFLPVLPYKYDNKLYFPLCRKCAENNNVFRCIHEECERQITGTWVIPEVALAVKQGYKILKVFEVWKYDYTIFDPKTQNGGLFTEYVNTFFKIKQEASGWSRECKTEVDKENFLKKFEERESIKLDIDNIKKNSGKRAAAKLILNCFWGKFAQRENKSFTSVFGDFKEFCNFIQSPGIEISSILPINEDTMWVNWRYFDENLNMLPHINIPVAAYTTAFARIKLYEAMQNIGNALLYCDTDSLIFIENKKTPSVFKISDYLGDLTDEVESFGPNAFISEFVSIGPKTYSFKVEISPDAQYITKCKGITINFQTSKIVNFNHLKSLVMGEAEEENGAIIKYENKIKRKRVGIVITEPQKKTLAFTFNKRILVDNHLSYPYGFKRIKLQE